VFGSISACIRAAASQNWALIGMIRMFLCSQQQRPQRPEMGGDWLNLSMHQGSRKPELDGDHHDCLCFCSQEQRSWRPEVGGDLRIYQTN
jgi:hypothetical protein